MVTKMTFSNIDSNNASNIPNSSTQSHIGHGLECIPLIKCCPVSIRDLVVNGVPEHSGHHNQAMNVATELISTANHLDSNGEPYSGTAKSYYDEFVLSSGIEPDSTTDGRFNSVQKKDVRKLLDDDKLQTCLDSWYGTKGSRPPQRIVNQVKAKVTPKPAPIPDGQIDLAKLPNIPTDTPKPFKPKYIPDSVVKSIPKDKLESVLETIYQYSETESVSRYDWESGKTFRAKGENGEILTGDKIKDFPLYKQNEAIANAQGKWVLLLEGEKCVEAATKIGLVAVTIVGSAWSDVTIATHQSLLKKSNIAGVIFLGDTDKTGQNKVKKWLEMSAKSGLPVLSLKLLNLWKEAPEKADIVEWIEFGKSNGLTDNNLIEQLDNAIKVASIERINQVEEVDNVIPFPPKTLKSPLEKILRELAEEDLTGTQLMAKKAAIAKESGQQISVVDNIYDDLLKESEREEDRESNKAELQQLIDIQNESISLYKFLPKEIATPIIALANRLNLRPEAFAISLIAGLSSTFARGTKLSIDGSGWVVRPNIYFALLANSSQKKSPVLNSMIKTPLGAIQSKERADYETRLKEYEIATEQYNILRKKPDQLADKFPDGPPEKPVFKLKFTTNLTLEGVLKQLGQQERGLIAVCDELAGLFKSLNQYKSGGNDGEVIIELYDGGDMSIVRAKNDPVPLESPLFSMVGGVQPGVLERELFAKGDDNGNWARFFFVKQPLAATELNVDGGDIDISEPILTLYQNFFQIPLSHYKLTYQARKLYFEAANRFEKSRVASADHPMGNVWGKASGSIGKLAITLHGIKYACQGAVPQEEIEPDIIEAAIALTRFLVNQSRSIYAELMGENSASLPAHLLKLFEFIKGQPDQVATVRDIVNRKKAKNKNHAIELLTELSEMKYGEIISAGKSLKFQLTRIDDKIDRIDDESTIELTTAKSLYSKDYKRIDDIDDKKNNFSKTIPTTHSLIEVNPENDNYSPIVVVNSVDSIVDNTQSNTQQGFNQSSIVVDSSSIASSIEDPVVDCVVNKKITPDFQVGDRVFNPTWGTATITEVDQENRKVFGLWSFQNAMDWAPFASLVKV
jgi:hypothetical protein